MGFWLLPITFLVVFFYFFFLRAGSTQEKVIFFHTGSFINNFTGSKKPFNVCTEPSSPSECLTNNRLH